MAFYPLRLRNGKCKYRIAEMHDGCFMRFLTIEIPTYSATRRTMRELIREGFSPDNLGVIDLETKQFVSFVW